ncbi:E3 ubiquitin-protein ligase RHF2A-like isoform X3 [Dioscorea cayenensis subsp. rotundata]|uniref:RING-type E3 ubiquitin transferase n=1 Tax=Dioscorea cayennensis subsp. rotundata TaxID=55577 RepID=A0AB40D2M0_DIOCR|nr:E3 ubiquitin-protein ligase RHF2A-like isoform X3 [Dioscorea cayenensis subsp. rotundata]
MDEPMKLENHASSAAAFVEGGVQDACDDSCSICLEAFCDSDPSTVTTCKHEFHLQCILEWCQRSSQCPMCWQPISLKDPSSQELLEAVESERNIRSNQTRTATIFHHPAFGEFDLQHLPVGANDSELEERIIQHLAAAAAMGRAHHIGRRVVQRGRSGAQGHPQFLLFSTNPSAPSSGSVSASSSQRGEDEPTPAIFFASPSAHTSDEEPPLRATNVTPAQSDQVNILPSGTTVGSFTGSGLSSNMNSPGQSSPVNHDRAGPSEVQSVLESLKSRLNTVSMRYKESVTKSTRGWKERLFSRNSSVADLGSEVRREVNAGIATVSRLIERLDTRDGRRATAVPASPDDPGRLSSSEPSIERVAENETNTIATGSNSSTSCATSSGSN